MFFIQFWKNWNKTERLFFWCFVVLFLVAAFFLWKSWAQYPAPAITLQEYQQIQTSETPTHHFSVGTLSIEVPAESLVILENMLGTPLQANPIAYHLYIIVLAVLFVFSSAAISTLNRFWFLIGSGLLILFLASLRFDALEILGMTGKIPFIALSIIIIASAYYFHSFKAEITFRHRISFFLLLTSVIGVAILFFSRVQHPFMHLATNGLIAGMIISVIFIFLIAHEVIAFFIWLISQGGSQSKSIRHFIVLSSIYMLNLFLSYATKMGFIQWNLWTINPLLLFTISALLGVWGFWQRREMYQAIFENESHSIFFYLVLGLVAFGTLAFFNATASDLTYDNIQDIILYTHIGFGLIFVFYIIVNFGPVLASNLPVFKILYKPETMPYFTFRLMGGIATLAALLFVSNWKRYVNEATAAYYYAYADLYLYQGDTTASEAYYQRSLRFRNQNHHAHYALASLAASKYDAAKEREQYTIISHLTPSVEGYLNLSLGYSLNGDVLRAALTLDEGLRKFPANGILQNAKGLSYLQFKQTDSSLYFFRKASQNKASKDMGQTNFMAACSIFKAKTAADSLLGSQNFNSIGAIINGLALANAQNKKISYVPEKKNDTILTVYQTAWLCNYFINQKENSDTTLLAYAERLANKPVNEDFRELILSAASHANYAKGEVKKAYETMRNLAYTTGEGKYFQLLGLWLLEQNNAAMASQYFKIAVDKNQQNSLFYYALANTESDSVTLALKNWDSLLHSKNVFQKEFASKMVKVLRSKNFNPVFSDEEKYYYARYKIDLLDSVSFFQNVNLISNKDLRALSLLDRAQKWFDWDESGVAESYLQKAQLENSRPLQPKIIALQLLLSADRQDFAFIQSALKDSLTVSYNQKVYLSALLDESQGKAAGAKEKYNYLAHANVQLEDALVASSRFFAADTTDRLKPYSILVEGLLAKPNSVKILKLHVLEAALLGFDEEAQNSLRKLQMLLPRNLYEKFVDSHPDFFSTE